MKRRRIRVGQIIAIAASLAFALFGAWYRAFIDRDGFFAQGGLMGLVAYLVAQLLLNAENEVAIEVLNYRHDGIHDRLCRVESALGLSPRDDCEDDL